MSAKQNDVDIWQIFISADTFGSRRKFSKRCTEIFKTASHEPIMQSNSRLVVGQTDDWLWKSSWFPTLY